MKIRDGLLVVFLLLLVISSFSQEHFNIPDEPRSLGKTSDALIKEYPSRKDDAVFLYNLGKALYENGEYESAQGYLVEAMELKPESPWIILYAGRVAKKLGDEDLAAQTWQKALEVMDNYEFLPIWKELVEVRPQYYANLGLLYRDKALENDDKDLARQGVEYLEQYLSKNPGGVFESQAEGAKNELNIMLEKEESKKRIASKQVELKRLEMERQMEIEQSRKDFRVSRKRMAGFHFVSFNPRNKFEFNYDGSAYVMDSVLSLEKFQVASLNSFQLTGGYLNDKWLFRGGLLIGSTGINKQFVVDTVHRAIRDTFEVIENPAKVKSAKTLLLAVQADYNFFYIDPILLYAGAGVDIGRLKLDAGDYEFTQEFLAGFGIDIGIMLHFNNLLIDLNIKPNLAGSSAGTNMLIGVMYKF
ncbi:MAG: tetratricopeptide repeat protein [Candidatus Zixiibacteriota bacterium]